MEPITYSLAENALDYLQLAGEQAKEGSPRMLKHALVTLTDGIELLLKARIEQKDWCLLFKDVDQASRSKYESGDFQSVLFDQAIKRLENLCSVTVSNDHLAVINEIRQLRNRVRHFRVTTDRPAAISLIVKTFSFAMEFISEHLSAFNKTLDNELLALRSLLGEFEAFVDERFGEILPQIHQEVCVVACPVCVQEAFALGGDVAHCLFCGHLADSDSAAYEWRNTFVGVGSSKEDFQARRVQICPECGAEACLDIARETHGRKAFICFRCGEEGDYQHCITCGQLCSRDSLGGMCGDCRGHYEDANS